MDDETAQVLEELREIARKISEMLEDPSMEDLAERAIQTGDASSALAYIHRVRAQLAAQEVKDGATVH